MIASFTKAFYTFSNIYCMFLFIPFVLLVYNDISYINYLFENGIPGESGTHEIRCFTLQLKTEKSSPVPSYRCIQQNSS